MELDKLKEAIFVMKHCVSWDKQSNDAKEVLIALASSVIAVSGILSVEDIRRIIIDEELMPRVCEDSGQAEWTVGESKKLAEAIHHRIAIALTGRFDVEKIEKILRNIYYSDDTFVDWDDRLIDWKVLAHAIREHFMGG